MAIFLKFEGNNNLKGQVNSKGHEDWIEIDNFQLGANRHIDTPIGNTNNREASRIHFDNVTLTKKVDRATPYLFGEANSGDALKSAVIHVCKTNKELDAYLEITLENVLISHFSIDSEQGDARNNSSDLRATKSNPTETIKLDFTKMEVRHTPSGTDNKPGTPSSSSINLEEATSA